MPGPRGDAALGGDGRSSGPRRSRSSRSRARAHVARRPRAAARLRSPAILVVLGAAYLVWLRPGAMTWGFFAYAIEFNPGQAYQFYAWLQQWPRAMLTKGSFAASCRLRAIPGCSCSRCGSRSIGREGRWRLDRARAAGDLIPVPGCRAHEPRKRVRLPDRIRDAGLDPDRLRGQRRRARDPARTPQGSVAARLPADPLGDLGLPHRPAGLSHRRNLAGDFAARRACSAWAR